MVLRHRSHHATPTRKDAFARRQTQAMCDVHLERPAPPQEKSRPTDKRKSVAHKPRSISSKAEKKKPEEPLTRWQLLKLICEVLFALEEARALGAPVRSVLEGLIRRAETEWPHWVARAHDTPA